MTIPHFIQKTFTDKRYFDFFISASALFLFFYVASRAFVIPLTWDEDYTFYQYVVKGNIFHQQMELMSANNHLLNTWFMWLSYQVFGDNIFMLRLPNVLSFAFYLLYSFKITKQVQEGSLRLAIFILLCSNPFLLDFFSIARGYGISMAFLMAGMYYFLLFFRSDEQRSIHISFLLISLATLANHTILYVAFSMAVVALIIILLKKIKYNIKQNAALISVTIFIFLYCIYTIIQLLKHGSLFYGGTTGFWYDTVNSLVFLSLYEKPYDMIAHLPIKIIVGVIIFWAFVLINRTVAEKKYPELLKPHVILFFIVIISILLQIVANFGLGVKFLYGRTALFFIPLTSLFLGFFLAEKIKSKNIQVILSYLIVSICTLHFIACMNWDYILLWK